MVPELPGRSLVNGLAQRVVTVGSLGRWGVLALTVVLVVTAVPAAAVAAPGEATVTTDDTTPTGADDGCRPPGLEQSYPEEANFTVTILRNQTNASVLTYEISTTVPSTVNTIKINTPLNFRRDIVATSGLELEEDTETGKQVWTWNGSADRIAVTYQLQRTVDNQTTFTTSTWGYTALSEIAPSLTFWCGENGDYRFTQFPPTDRVTYRVDQGSVDRVGWTIRYGPGDEWYQSAFTHDNRTVVVSAVRSAPMSTDLATITTRLQTNLQNVTLLPRRPNWTFSMVAVPPRVWDSERFVGYAVPWSAAVRSDFLYGQAVDEVWVHEYIHLQQAWVYEDDFEWFFEASADYLTFRLMARSGTISERAVRERLNDPPAVTASSLANTSSWESFQVPYRKGARVLYALDAKIRAATDGNRTLFAVFRRLNRQSNFFVDGVQAQELDNAVFKRTVENVSGESMDDWLDHWLYTTEGTKSLVNNTNASVFTDDEPSPLAPYTDDSGVVQTEGLNLAIADWAAGEIDTEFLRRVIQAWARGQPVD